MSGAEIKYSQIREVVEEADKRIKLEDQRLKHEQKKIADKSGAAVHQLARRRNGMVDAIRNGAYAKIHQIVFSG